MDVEYTCGITIRFLDGQGVSTWPGSFNSEEGNYHHGMVTLLENLVRNGVDVDTPEFRQAVDTTFNDYSELDQDEDYRYDD